MKHHVQAISITRTDHNDSLLHFAVLEENCHVSNRMCSHRDSKCRGSLRVSG
jgi:hypothetical protein